jgi:GTP-binding protein HflX
MLNVELTYTNFLIQHSTLYFCGLWSAVGGQIMHPCNIEFNLSIHLNRRSATHQNYSTDPGVEKAILVGVIHDTVTGAEAEEHLEELAMLADTAGARVVGRFLQRKVRVDPATVIGIGKVREISQACEFLGASLVIFDDELNPAQVKNLESEFKVKVLDRSGLILDIFASRARTREAQTQVELAQLEYLYPRLTRQWTHLSRQVGGIGTRGPGETQLEADRRLIRKRISVLRGELKRIDRQRVTRREGRRSFRQVALIGYTNAGKSSLLNALTQSDVFVENRLFATLDATVRSLPLKSFPKVLISDTVGFIRKLPHHLIASFKSTLEETVEADLLIHIIDITNPSYDEHIRTTHELLEYLKLSDTSRLMVFNKVDIVEDRTCFDRIKMQYPDSLFVSAQTGLGLSLLLDAIELKLRIDSVEQEVRVRIDGKALSFIHHWSEVVKTVYEDDTVLVTYRSSPDGHARIIRFLENLNETSYSDRR